MIMTLTGQGKSREWRRFPVAGRGHEQSAWAPYRQKETVAKHRGVGHGILNFDIETGVTHGGRPGGLSTFTLRNAGLLAAKKVKQLHILLVIQ